MGGTLANRSLFGSLVPVTAWQSIARLGESVGDVLGFGPDRRPPINRLRAELLAGSLEFGQSKITNGVQQSFSKTISGLSADPNVRVCPAE